MIGFLKQITFLGAVAFVASQELVCSSPSKYHIPNVKDNWIGAVEHCHRIGMRLAVVDSAAEQMEIARLAQASSIFNAARTFMWIGANDQAQEGKFVWNATGMKLKYTNWAPRQPDNKGGVEHCVHMWYEPAQNLSWKWNDIPCSTLYYFVCENVPVRML